MLRKKKTMQHRKRDQKGGQCCNLTQGCKGGLIEMTFDERFKRVEEVSCGHLGKEHSRERETASANNIKWNCISCVQGIARRPVCL